MQSHTLTILLTSKCTARCDHCCVNSGPERNDAVDFETIKKTIENIYARGSLKTVVFAGGEPTLRKKDLLKAISLSNNLGLNTRLVTNASWAISVEKAQALLQTLRLAGLSELNISADDFHLPFIPFQRVVNAWNASQGLGFKAIIIANSSGPRSVITPQFIMEQLGEVLPLRYNDGEANQDYSVVAEDGCLKGISNSLLQRIGRATQSTKDDDLVFPKVKQDINVPCPFAGTSPALSPKGHLVACCGFEVEGLPTLDFGNARDMTADTLLDMAADDVLLTAIRELGPGFLMKTIQRLAPEVEFRSNYASICEICEHVMARAESRSVLARHVPSIAHAILKRRDLAKGGGVGDVA